MVRACWEYAKAHQFPNATLRASTLDEFGQILWDARDRLPVVSQEIGNAWLPQMGTDPWRLRAIREVSRLRNAWCVLVPGLLVSWPRLKDTPRTVLSTPGTSGYRLSYKRVLRAVLQKPLRSGIF